MVIVATPEESTDKVTGDAMAVLSLVRQNNSLSEQTETVGSSG